MNYNLKWVCHIAIKHGEYTVETDLDKSGKDRVIVDNLEVISNKNTVQAVYLWVYSFLDNILKKFQEQISESNRF